MASRFNTRFAFTLAVISMTVIVILGGLGFLAYRANTQRHITAGDELMAQGEYITALKEYGRAVDKEKSVLSHLAKYEEALMKIRPATPIQALEYYARYIGVFRHKLRYQPTSSKIHLEYLSELYSAARLMGSPLPWGELYRAANEMKAGVPQSDPDHVYAELYLGLSTFRKSPIPTRVEIQEATEHLNTFLEAVPDSDKGWAGRVQLLLSESYRNRDAGNKVIAQDLSQEADKYLKQAREAVINGPDIAKLHATRLVQHQLAGDNTIQDEEIAQAIDEMVDFATASSDSLDILELSNTIKHLDRAQGVDRGIEILEAYISNKPLSYLHQFILADLLLLADKYDESNEYSNKIIDAEPLAVSLLSRYLPILQIRSASLVVDCEFERWESGDEQEKSARLITMAQARERLAKHVSDPDKQPLLLRADGKIAYAQGNLHVAAEKFERCLTLMPTLDFELLLYSAQILERIGQEGAAIGRIDAALKERKGNLYLLRKKANLQLKLMHFDDAFETISEALRRDPDNENTQKLATIIENARRQHIGIEISDIDKALAESREEIDAGNSASARTILHNALEENGADDVRLLYVLAVLELQEDQIDLARDYLDRALEIQPTNQNLRILQSTIGIDDPLERIVLSLKTAYPTEPLQTVMLAVELLRRADQLERIAAQNKEAGSDEDEAALQQASRTRSEGSAMLVRAKEIAPNHRVILDYLLTQALLKKEWESAEKIVEQARVNNVDQAQGLLFQGRYEISREQFEQAVQTLTKATEVKPYEAHPWRLLGRAYESLANNTQAHRAYSEAYDRDPNDPIVVDWHESLLERMGKYTSALRVLRASQSLMDRNQTLKNRWLRLEASIGDIPLAIRKRREMYKHYPKFIPNAMQLASLLVQTKPTFEHINDEEGIQRYSSDRWLRLSSEQRAIMLQDVSRQWLEESNKIVDAIQADQGEIIDIIFLRASLLKDQGKIAEGDKVIVDFLQKHDESQRTINMYLGLGQYRISTDQLNSAVTALDEGRKYQSADKLEADNMLANLYYSRQVYKKAAELYADIVEVNSDREASLRLVECYTNLKEIKKASDLLNEITERDGPDLYSIVLHASIVGLEAHQAFEAEGEVAAHAKFEKQRNLLDEAQILYPGDPRPYIQQASSYLREYKLTGRGALISEARLILNETDEIQSGISATSYVRTEILLALDDVPGAIGELNRLLKQRPDDLKGRITLISLYEKEGNYSAALGLVLEAIELNPILTAWHTKKGDLYAKQNSLKEAVLAYIDAFMLKPSHESLIRIMDTSLRAPNPEYTSIVTFFNNRGSEFIENGNIILHSLFAQALYGDGKRELALEQLRIGYEKFTQSSKEEQSDFNALDKWLRATNAIFREDGPTAIEKFVNEVTNNDPSAYCLDWIARVWFGLGADGRSRAIELQQLALSKCPDDQDKLRANLLVNLGTYRLADQAYEASVIAFTEALDYNPNHFAALNNAAYVKGRFLNQADEALLLAKRAKNIKPDDPNVLDTLGWLYYLNDQYDEAERELRESVKLSPTASSIYHLASVFFKQGRLDTAQTRLNRAAELNPDPETSADIARLSDDISKARNR